MTCPRPPVGLGGDNASEASEMNAWSKGRTFHWIGLDWIVEAGRDQICSCGSYLAGKKALGRVGPVHWRSESDNGLLSSFFLWP